MRIENENYLLYDLPWDTDYFGVKSCRLDLKQMITEAVFKDIKKEIQKYSFIAINNNNNEAMNNYLIGSKTNAFLVDVNIQFKKKIEKNHQKINHQKIKISNNYTEDKKILSIAREAYCYSKFTNDPFLKRKKGEDVYYYWIKNAFNCENKYFLVSEIENKCQGYILFSMNIKENKAMIELIAVNKECQRKNIGYEMIECFEAFLLKHSIKVINVGTQTDNIPAINFYFKCGFKEDNHRSVYHWWRNNY
ncbi:MAG: GNAT family N-acetyltransferase [Eubacterium sp.]